MLKRFPQLLIVAALLAVAFLLASTRPALAADSDLDGFSDTLEAHVGTDPNDACGQVVGGLPAWPPDINSDTAITASDLSAIAADIGKNVPPAPVRKDIAPEPVGDNAITASDLSRIGGLIGQSCRKTYYIDAVNGLDTDSGLTPDLAWQTSGKVSSLSAAAQGANTFLFFRDQTFTQTLTIKSTADRVTVSSHGSGAFPIIDTSSGNCVEVQGNTVDILFTQIEVTNCETYGFNLVGPTGSLITSSFNTGITLDNVRATHNVAGVRMASGFGIVGFPVRVANSVIQDNNRMSVNDAAPDNDSGAFGVLVNNGPLLFENNECHGQDAASFDYIRDGACIEFYSDTAGFEGALIRFNRASGNDAFIENTHPTDPYNNLTINQNHVVGVDSRMIGINSDGTNHTVAANTIVMPYAGTGTEPDRGGQAIVGNGGTWSVRSNLLVGGWKAIFVNNNPSIRQYNNFVGLVQNYTLGTGDINGTDDCLAADTDRHVTVGSVCDQAGDTATNTNLGVQTPDMDGTPVPSDGRREIGVDELP